MNCIKEFYGFDYRPDWHGDLDSLCKPAAQNYFSSDSRGAFWTLTNPDGSIAGCGGLYALTWKPQLAVLLESRYPDPAKVASVARVYVAKDQRGKGLGKRLNGIIESAAPKLGYDTLYLHANSDAADTLAFWNSCGYSAFGTLDFSTHLDKKIG